MENPTWNIRETYENALTIEGGKVNLRQALNNINPLRSLHIHAPLETFPEELVSAYISWKRVNLRLFFEHQNYPHSNFENEAIEREFARRQIVIFKPVEDLVEKIFGMRGSFTIGYGMDCPEGVVPLIPFAASLNSSQIETLLKSPKIDFTMRFKSNSNGIFAVAVNTTLEDETTPDLRVVNSPIPRSIVDPNLEEKERFKLFIEDREKIYPGVVSEDAPVIISALMAARV